jgi:hypothetical protein
MRATTSTPPPGAKGTSSRIGRVGNFACAEARSHEADIVPRSRPANNKPCTRVDRGIVASRLFMSFVLCLESIGIIPGLECDRDDATLEPS